MTHPGPRERDRDVLGAVPDPYPLRTIPIPRDVTDVDGCDCGGTTWHRKDCSLWALPLADQLAAVTAAEDRIRAFTTELNRKLRER